MAALIFTGPVSSPTFNFKPGNGICCPVCVLRKPCDLPCRVSELLFASEYLFEPPDSAGRGSNSTYLG